MSVQLDPPFLNPVEYSAIHDGIIQPAKNLEQLGAIAGKILNVFSDISSIREAFNRYRGYANLQEKLGADILEKVLLDPEYFCYALEMPSQSQTDFENGRVFN